MNNAQKIEAYERHFLSRAIKKRDEARKLLEIHEAAVAHWEQACASHIREIKNAS